MGEAGWRINWAWCQKVGLNPGSQLCDFEHVPSLSGAPLSSSIKEGDCEFKWNAGTEVVFGLCRSLFP